MRGWLLAAVILLMWVPASQAADPPFRAGIVRLTTGDGAPVDLLAWFPTRAAATASHIGPFVVPATDDAPPAEGRFPIVLLSHGGGLTGGTPLILGELSAALARHGFVVIAPFHGTSRLPLRPIQVVDALRAVLADPRFAAHVDVARLGMIGFSLGGAVTLELAGAMPDTAYFSAYCATHLDDAMSCDHAPGGQPPRPGPTGQPRPRAVHAALPAPLKAIVLLDPLAAMFPREGLTAVTLPVLLLRPDQSQLPGDGNALALAAALRQPTPVRHVPGRHFIFTDRCAAPLASAAPEICQDPPGVDRGAVHDAVAAAVIQFFDDHL